MKKFKKNILALALAFSLLGFGGTAAAAITPAELQEGGERLLYPGGMPFGVKFLGEGLMVVGFSDVPCDGESAAPAYDAGLRVNDIIKKIDGEPVTGASELLARISDAPLSVTYERDGEEETVSFTPVRSTEDGKYKTGMWVRDTTAGIGTVTYIEPETGAFGGLGHGICDGTTGELIPMHRGSVIDVEINGINRGAKGTPGELVGYFKAKKTGVLLDNTKSGVYGILTEIPYDKIPEPALPVASRDEVEEGQAWIWSTLDDNEVRRYEIEITGIHPESEDNRNFELVVTDEELLRRTGGIVQGMSGSTIIQNGKIVGAVTHVLVGDPARGYGIYIENMLEEGSKTK